MATSLTNRKLTATTAEVAAYTVPANTSSVLIGANVSNKSALNVYVTVKLGTFSIITNAPIPPGSSLSILDGKIVMIAGEALTVQADVNSAADIILSIAEEGVA